MSDQPGNKPPERPENDPEKSTGQRPPEASGAGDAPEQPATKPPAPRRGINPVTVFTLVVLLACVALFVWHMVADRFTPYTAKARVEAFTVPIAPQVSAYVKEILVKPNERVTRGQILVQLDRKPFQLAVQSARAALAKAGQNVGARTASVDSAAAQLDIARVRLERARRNYDRVQRISKNNPGALSEADRDRAVSSLEQSKAQLISARAKLERAKQQLGEQGPQNPMIASAVAALDLALYNLSQTTITAPADGWIGNLPFDVGSYAAAGHPLMAFISAADTWIQADMRENNLLHLVPGNPVEFVLDVAPGRIFRGSIRSVGVGVSTGQGSSPGDLPVVQGAQGWLRDPQRFPVLISLGGDVPADLLRTGGQVDVMVYTGNRPFLNTLARWRIRLAAWLSYVW
jgi:multidrug resistance efflux pump